MSIVTLVLLRLAASETVSDEAWEHFDLVNQLRAAGYTCPQGRSYAANPTPLRFDCRLWKASKFHSADMAAQNYFSHTSLDGRSPWDRAEAQGIRANGENIAAGRSSPSGVLEQWKKSDGHCKNMMNSNFKVFAVGYASDSSSRYRHYWTQMFKSDVLDLDTSCYPTTATATTTTIAATTTTTTTFTATQSAIQSTSTTKGTAFGTVSDEAWEHFDLVNQLRAAGYTCPQGRSYAANPTPLRFDCRLWKASKFHSADMAAQNYFSHTSLDGRSPWDRAEAQGIRANGENIAAGRSSPSGVLEQWKKSDGHCKNMMNSNFKVFAVGYASDSSSRYRHYWTQMFKSDVLDLDTSCYPTTATAKASSQGSTSQSSTVSTVSTVTGTQTGTETMTGTSTTNTDTDTPTTTGATTLTDTTSSATTPDSETSLVSEEPASTTGSESTTTSLAVVEGKLLLEVSDPQQFLAASVEDSVKSFLAKMLDVSAERIRVRPNKTRVKFRQSLALFFFRSLCL